MRKLTIVYEVVVIVPTEAEIVITHPSSANYECNLDWLEDERDVAECLKDEISGFGYHEQVDVKVSVLSSLDDVN